MPSDVPLTDLDRALYEWQMWVPGLDESGQRKLKNATVLISRCGGIGGTVALYLASAGIGKLIIAHAGNVEPADLNRQILMTRDWLGKPRVASAALRLQQLNPDLQIETLSENVSEENAERLVSKADLIVDCAPRFNERFLLNRESVRQRKSMVECAMYELEVRVTTFVPGQTPCLACLHPETPPAWKRQFPVLGAVAGLAACMGAMEVIKLIVGPELGEPLLGRMAVCDLRNMNFQTLKIFRNPECKVCAD